MANIKTNPWSFTNADQAASVAISSIASAGYSSLVTTGSAHGLSLNQQISLQGCTTTPAYNGGYSVQSIPSTTTFLIAQVIPNLAANGANGNVLTVAYPFKVRIEQMSWVAAPASSTLLITDTNGNIVWTYTTSSTADQVYTYGKLYWVDGLVMNTVPSASTVLATIN
jgi:hypothetical protein